MTTNVTARSLTLPVSLGEAKAHLHVEHGDDDVHIQSLIEAATEYVESQTGRAFRLSETMVQVYDCWPRCRFGLDRQPVTAVSHLKFYDADNTLQTVASSNYRLHKSLNAAGFVEIDGDFTRPTHYSRDDAIQLTYTAGYPVEVVAGDDITTIGVPAMAKHAIKLQLGLLFGNLDPRVISNEEKRLADCIGQLQWGAYR